MRDFLREVNQDLEKLVNFASSETLKTGLAIGTTAQEGSWESYLSPWRVCDWLISASAIVATVEEGIELAILADGLVDFILVDAEKKLSPSHYGSNDVGNLERGVREAASVSQVIPFRGNSITATSAELLIQDHFLARQKGLDGKVALVWGAGNLGAKISSGLVERGCVTYLHRRNEPMLKSIVQGINASKPVGTIAEACVYEGQLPLRSVDILVGTSSSRGSIPSSVIDCLRDDAIAIDAGKGNFEGEAFERLLERGIPAKRLTIDLGWQGFVGALRAQVLQPKSMPYWRVEKGGDTFVVKGYVARPGEFLVDHLPNPTTVLGQVSNSLDLTKISTAKEKKLLDRF